MLTLEMAIQKIQQFTPEQQNKVIEFIELLEFEGDRFTDDPLEPLIGSIQSNIPDWTENSDRYLGENILK